MEVDHGPVERQGTRQARSPREQVADAARPSRRASSSSDEYLPIAADRAAEAGRGAHERAGDEYGRKNGLSRRRFFQTAAGMATAFVAMNEVYGRCSAPRRPRPRASTSRRRAPTG
jgi:hypothetical protein